MVKGSALSLASGTLSEVVPESITSSSTAVIYDARCSDSVYAWLELDLVTRDWWLYASSFSDGALTGETKTLWQGTSDYDPAPFACSGAKVIWQVQPSTSGAKTSENSYCYVWTSGAGDATAAVESPGRFATKPSVSNGYVVVSPRVHADEGVYYGITAYTLDDDLSTRVDQLVMPVVPPTRPRRPRKPIDASSAKRRTSATVDMTSCCAPTLSTRGRRRSGGYCWA